MNKKKKSKIFIFIKGDLNSFLDYDLIIFNSIHYTWMNRGSREEISEELSYDKKAINSYEEVNEKSIILIDVDTKKAN